MDLNSQKKQFYIGYSCFFGIYGFFIVLFLSILPGDSSILFSPLLFGFILSLLGIISIIISIRRYNEILKKESQINQFLSQIPSESNDRRRNTLFLRLKLILIKALIAEEKSQLKKAAQLYFIALIIDQEIDTHYSQKILERMDTTFPSSMIQLHLPPNHIQLEIDISLLEKNAQDAEHSNNISLAILLYKKVFSIQKRLYQYHEALHSYERMSHLRKNKLI
jgi:hypothetical protein